jgi:hypothetical protein
VYSLPLDVMHHYEIGAGAAPRVVHREVIRREGTDRLTFARTGH